MSRPLSKRAENLLARVRRGEWYPTFGRHVPKAMRELVDAGMVGTAGRVVTVKSCYVPAEGFIELQRERFPDEPEAPPLGGLRHV
jgi:hypothetical protein